MPTDTRVITDAAAFRHELLEAGLLVRTRVDGLYHRSGVFEEIARAVEARVSRAGADQQAPKYYFPPLMPRESFERTGYLRSFPDLIGAIQIFAGDDDDHSALLDHAAKGGDWASQLSPAEVALCSAACHPLYETLTEPVPEAGHRYEVQGYCFRHEPSLEPTRMQSFRQHEFVFVGTAAGALAHRDRWLERGLRILDGLGLDVAPVVANDPFFGRAGRMLSANQRDTALKYEIVCPVNSTDKPTAIASANYHQDHFGAGFGIRTENQETAHTACIGFGLERITLALLATHGLDVHGWPASVRDTLWPRSAAGPQP